jgi:hypothetical protein
MTFTRHEEFINPSRISPALLVIRNTTQASQSARLNVGSRVAICVSAGMCLESFMVEPHQGTGSAPRKRRYLSLLFHNQEWERWESCMCLAFSETFLFTQMTDFAVHMGSVISPAKAEGSSSVTLPRRM